MQSGSSAQSERLHFKGMKTVTKYPADWPYPREEGYDDEVFNALRDLDGKTPDAVVEEDEDL